MSAEKECLDSRYRFETPEAVHLWYAPVGPVVRAQAWLRDGLVKLLFFILIMLGKSMLGGAGDGFALVALFLLEWFYPVFFETLNQGMTPAKQWMGIRVVRADGTPVGWTDALVRNLLRVMDFMPMFYAAGLFAMMTNARFQRFGDLVANTVVIYNEPVSKRQRRDHGAEAQAAPVELTREEQQAFIQLRERKALLSPQRQTELAAIVAPVLGVAPADALVRCDQVAASLAGSP